MASWIIKSTILIADIPGNEQIKVHCWQEDISG
jgi:hypothetical protein